MGQGESTPIPEGDEDGREVTLEELSKEIATKFAGKCYTSIELYHFKEVFRSHAATESGLRYWKEGTLTEFLELPASVEVDHVIYQMATSLGAFPFPSLSPCILTIEALMKIVTLLTERYAKVLKNIKKEDRLRVLYACLAVFDRRASEKLEAQHEFDQAIEPTKEELLAELSKGISKLEMENAADSEPLEDHQDEDSLAIAALDFVGAAEAHKLTARPKLDHSIIPADNLLKLIELLLLVAPLGPQDSVAAHPELTTDEAVKDLRQTAARILAAFQIEGRPGITFRSFSGTIPAALPRIFDPLGPLFEHFLFGKHVIQQRRRRNTSISSPLSINSPVIGNNGDETNESPDRSRSPGSPHPHAPLSPSSPRRSMSGTSETFPSFAAEPEPILAKEGDILTRFMLSQLSFFMPSDRLFRHMYPLLSGNEHGFSLGSFESQVFSWQAPTLLLVQGTILSETPANARERHFTDHLPPKRFPSNVESGKRVTYGAYIPVPWHTTHKAAIGTPGCILFEISPVHDVFTASTISKDYITFLSAPHSAHVNGIGFGNSMPIPTTGQKPIAPLGPVSLFMDEGLEFGVFTHTAAVGSAKTSGGSFQPSQAPARATKDWQNRFEIDALEVWGMGGAEQSRQRSRTLEFEEREARMRREGRASVVGAAGVEADREILKMAGLIGHGEEGGSMVGGDPRHDSERERS